MFDDIIKKLVKDSLGIDISLEVPEKVEFGDVAFPCFVFAKELKKSPAVLAKEFASKLKPAGIIREVLAIGPYVNIFFNTAEIGKLVIKRVEVERQHFGSNHSGKGMHALIEHTSINPNASPHVGRARNALIGDCLARLLRFEGYKTEVHYFVNDVGKQIALLVLGCRGKKNVSFEQLLQIYIEANARLEKDPGIEKEVFGLLEKFEAGDENIMKEFREVVDTCIAGQKKILGRLGIMYDKFDYESDYIINKKTNAVLGALDKTGRLFVDEQGRKVLDLKGFSLPLEAPFMVLTRADGTSLYATRDLAYNLDKNVWAEGKNIIVLGEDQKVYHQEVTSALSLLGEPAPVPVHYSFVLLKSGKMSTRKGNVVLLEDFMQEAVKRAHAAMQREFSEEKAKQLAEIVGFGAVKFAILKVSNDKPVTFEWDAVLKFEGDTAPYCQYSHARIHSIFARAGVRDPRLPENAAFSSPFEHRLVLALGEFPRIVSVALDAMDPSVIIHFVLKVAKLFSEFYHQCPVLQAEKEVRESRLALLNATRIVIENGLSLLGIDAPEEM